MTEVIGTVKSCDDTKMIITDLDGDDIEMDHSGLTENPANAEKKEMRDKILQHFKALVGKRVSYYYDEDGLLVGEHKSDVKIIDTPSGRRTLESLAQQAQRVKNRAIRKINALSLPDVLKKTLISMLDIHDPNLVRDKLELKQDPEMEMEFDGSSGGPVYIGSFSKEDSNEISKYLN